MPTNTDPVTSLIAALAANGQPSGGNGQAAGNTDRLSEAAELIPNRVETAVRDLADSPALAKFRSSYAAGMIEAKLVDEVLQILRAVLVARGLLPA